MTDGSAPDTIVLIHGFWVTPRSWEHWAAYYEGRATASSRPRIPASRSRSRRSTPTCPRSKPPTVSGVVSTSSRSSASSNSPSDPDRPLRGRDVRPAPARPRPRRSRRGDQLRPDGGGARGPAVAAQVDLPGVQEPANRHRAVSLTHEQWQYAFTNTFGEEESRALYERYAIPASGKILWGIVLANFQLGHQEAWVDYKNDDRAPLLFISGSEDNLMPPEGAAVEREALQVRHGHGDQGVRRPRRTCCPPRGRGWEEAADHALEWALKHAAVPARA